MFKKILPVGIAVILIVVIAVTVSLVKKANDRTPTLSNADQTYASYGDLNLTYDRLYTYMKNNYGVNELLDMVDEKLYADELSKLDVNSEEYVNYVKDKVFKTHELSEMTDSEKVAAQESWDDLILSLKMTGLLKNADIDDSTYSNESSKVWEAVKNNYKLTYVREKWAKEAYWKRYLDNREDDYPFPPTNKESSTDSIEAYFKDNYSGKTIGFFVPFTSEASAYAAMEKYGVNVNSTVLSTFDGWVKNTYNYYTTKEPAKTDKFSFEEVLNIFINMYNDNYAYLNDGNPVLPSDCYEEVLLNKQTAYNVAEAIKNAFSESHYGISITVPTTVEVTGHGNAEIIWTVSNSTYGKVENNVISANFDAVASDETEISLNLSFKVLFGDDDNEESVTSSLSIVLQGERDENGQIKNSDTAVTSVSVASVDPYFGLVLKDEYLDEDAETFRFIWTKAQAEAINATLANYLSVSSTNLVLSENPEEIYKAYTGKPVAIGDYYYLIIKLKDEAQPELFAKDINGEVSADANGKYTILDQATYDEIVEKKKEALLTENAVNEMIHTNRYEHGLKIYDAYIEAIYEYQYKTFYETTLSSTDYNKYKTTKKKQKTLLAEFKVGDDTVKFNVQDLFDRLEKKYAATAVATFIENYILVNDEKYNKVYNPYTNKVLDQDAYKNLLTSELSTLKQNFEADYFTYSYLSYYGFTPNFSHKYGWQKFIKDYFNAYSDQELLATSFYGGSIYTDALHEYTLDQYTLADVRAKMEEAYNKWFGLSVINLIVSIDTNYNADSSSSSSADIAMEEKDNWTDEQKELAKELASLMFEVAKETNGATLSDQMNALVTLYKDAPYYYDEAEWNTARSSKTSIYDYNYFGKYKLAGLNVKFETANSYDSSSSIVEEFKDACSALWAKANDLNLVGTTFDQPLFCDEPFFTDYGLHYIAALSANERLDLPTDDEVKLYRAHKALDDAKKAVETAQTNIDTYSKNGYNTSSYQATKALNEKKVARYQAEWDALLKELNLKSDYTIPTDVQTKIDKWYTSAQSDIEGGTLVTRSYIAKMQSILSNINFDSNGKTNKTNFEEFLGLLIEACDDSDAE